MEKTEASKAFEKIMAENADEWWCVKTWNYTAVAICKSEKELDRMLVELKALGFELVRDRP